MSGLSPIDLLGRESSALSAILDTVTRSEVTVRSPIGSVTEITLANLKHENRDVNRLFETTLSEAGITDGPMLAVERILRLEEVRRNQDTYGEVSLVRLPQCGKKKFREYL